jgi:hypothetical protein
MRSEGSDSLAKRINSTIAQLIVGINSTVERLATGGRQKGTRNRATAEARAAAEAIGILPLTYMLEAMRDAKADQKRRDAMAIAAAPYLHPKLSTIDAKLNGVAQTQERVSSIQVSFVRPRRTNEDDEGEA